MKSWTDAIEEIKYGGSWTDITIPSASNGYITASFTNCKINSKLKIASISGTVHVNSNFVTIAYVSTVYPAPKAETNITLSGSYFIRLSTNGTSFGFGSNTDMSNSGSTYSFTDIAYILA